MAPPAVQAQDALAPAERVFRVTLPFLFDKSYKGDITSEVTTGGSVRVDVERMIALFGDRIAPATADAARALADDAGMVPIARLGDIGIDASYDAERLELDFAIAAERQGVQTLSAAAIGSGRHRSYIPESGFSASATVTVFQQYIWSSQTRTTGFEPVSLSSDIAANLGGADGVSLFGQLEYDGGRGGGFDRGNFQLFHDDEARAIRYALGDIAPGTAGFQTSPLMGGLSVERRYGEIQPLRSIRPSGQFSFVLDRQSTVDVVVNGSTLRTLQLSPGQYSLRDFPFFNGLNQVELYAVDDAGRRLIATFSQYYSARLLDRGILEFGVDAGVLQNRGGGDRYGGAPAFSGYARYGLTTNLTVGANLQLSDDQWNAGTELSLATPVGTIGLLASYSDHDAAGDGVALLASYEGAFGDLGPLQRVRVNLEAQKTSRSFTALTLATPYNAIDYRLSGRVSAALPARFSLGLAASYYAGRDAEPDQTRYAVNLSRSFGRLNVTGSLERLERSDARPETRGLLTLSLPLGRRRNLRGSYDTRANSATVELSSYRRDELGGLGYRVGVSRSDSETDLRGDVSYAANRFLARVSHNAVGTADGRITGQVSDYTLSTQIAIAGGQPAWGRPVGERFAIVRGHRTLDGAAINVWQGPVRERPQGRSAATGPALVSVGSAYLPTQLRVEVPEIPPGYDLGPGMYWTRPGPASGYLVTVGSNASRVIIGTAVDAGGAPLPLLGGKLLPVDRPDAEPILFFTNRAGRFVASGLAPGRYVLLLGPQGSGRAEIALPERAGANMRLGEIRFEGISAPPPQDQTGAAQAPATGEQP
ncbi:fimbrial biogenesis outer membrane usher protein [Stakelama tenebrarum]|uniref:Fimbrial biogenesis outer membrane usher protein n=1 Tax=Stakelama tenebrarum TaxID=2711215 RepID=A0A6G6Y272_9SPHN|nr:fimbrial biogenesis outer membrane usher protein [Sphingosinithalassobacter tenebrarum]QIG79044.1 fimbrial biogenesis outer membrane usher protein [Sphingosinithalassobacter tenebrarum]